MKIKVTCMSDVICVVKQSCKALIFKHCMYCSYNIIYDTTYQQSSHNNTITTFNTAHNVNKWVTKCKCDWICEKGSYSLSKFLSLTDHNFSRSLTYHFQISPVNSTMLGVYSDWISGWYLNQMGCQVHAIGKAIRPLYADPVTNYM